MNLNEILHYKIINFGGLILTSSQYMLYERDTKAILNWTT